MQQNMSAGQLYDRYTVLPGNPVDMEDRSLQPLTYSSNVNGDFFWSNESRITQYMSKMIVSLELL